MAGILKAIKGGNAHACSSLENYLTDIKKLIGNEAIGIDCDPYTFDSDFAFDRIEHSVDKKARAYVHYTLSYRDSDGLSHEEILEQAKKLVERIDEFKDHKIAIICHSDTPNHPHCHIVVSAVNSKTGRKLSLPKCVLARAKETLIALDREKGLEPEKKTHRGIRNQSMKAYKTAEKGEKGDPSIWKVVLKNAVVENINKAKSKEEFIKLMESKGYMVKWEDNNKNITIIDSEGNKRRLSNIEKEYPEYEGKLSKESLLETFKLNEVKGHGAELQSLADKYQVDIKAIEKSLEVKKEKKEEIKEKTKVKKEKTKVKEENQWDKKLEMDKRNSKGIEL